jgi:hypothetical protein
VSQAHLTQATIGNVVSATVRRIFKISTHLTVRPIPQYAPASPCRSSRITTFNARFLLSSASPFSFFAIPWFLAAPLFSGDAASGSAFGYGLQPPIHPDLPVFRLPVALVGWVTKLFQCSSWRRRGGGVQERSRPLSLWQRVPYKGSAEKEARSHDHAISPHVKI